MYKLNSAVFNSSVFGFNCLNFGIQPKLLVTIPDQTKITGKQKLSK